jgi:CRP-like cAMP-binding protein
VVTSGVFEPPVPRHTFDGLDDDLIAYCLEHAALVSWGRGDLLYRQGEPPILVHVIRDGFVKLVSTSADGHEVLVGIAGPRDILGQAALVRDATAYLVTATALTPVGTAVWTREKATELAHQFPEVHRRLDAQLIRNYEILLGRLHTVSEGRVPQRLARALRELGERHGERLPDGTIRLAPPLTRQDLAAVVGTTLFSASRLLADWEDRGIIRSARARISIVDLDALEELAAAE